MGFTKPIEQFLFSYQGAFNVSKRYYTRGGLFMKQGTLFYDRKSGRYNFHYVDEDGDRRDYGGIHCGEVFE